MIEYDDLGRVNAPYADELSAAFRRTLDGGWFVLGKAVQEFERSFASMLGARHCIGVASGLDAITLSFLALDLPKNAEVLVASNTYIATILSIIHAGLRPVLVEPDLRTYNLDPDLIAAHLSPRTRAIVVTHLYGKPARMDRIGTIAREHGLRIVEDAAQAIDARVTNRFAGTWGDAGAFSFYPTKNLGALGDGGAVVTDSDEIAERILYLRNYGSKVKYHNKVIGHNSRLDEMQAAFLLVKLAHLHKVTAHKRLLASHYLSGLSSRVVKPFVESECEDVFHIFPIRCRERDSLRAHLLERGIKTEIHYPIPPHRQEALAGHFQGDYPLADQIHRTILSLPISTIHTPADVARVIETIDSFFS